jgi:hypothetical protein
MFRFLLNRIFFILFIFFVSGTEIKSETHESGFAAGAGIDMSTPDMSTTMSSMTGVSTEDMSTLGMDKMAASTGLTPGMVATMSAAGIAGMDVTSVIATQVAGLGSTAVTELAAAAAAGTMSTSMMGDMMETGLVNQGTMAVMGSKGMEGFSSAMGMEGGDMGLAAMSGGMAGMGDMVGTIDASMAESMGMDPNAMVDMMEPMAGTSMNLGQVSTAMGTGVSAGDALGSASAASVAASEAGT